MRPIDPVLELHPTPLALAEVRRLNLRRCLFLVPSVCLATAVLIAAAGVLASKPHGWLDWALLLPFGVAMSWECLIVWQLILGFAQRLRGTWGLSTIERIAAAVEPSATGRSRTAVLMPIYEEDVAAVFARVRLMRCALQRLGSCDDIEMHVLSDTRSADAATAEAAAAQQEAASGDVPLFYRRRTANTGRKAGNIADFLEQHGNRFDFAVVLDADSLMTGAAIRRLIRAMEESPRVGLLQTVSYAAGRTTLFARIQQFAVRLYAPLALRGLHFWQGPEGSYWGHNAIFRIAPFRVHCRLPILSGEPPLGGEILCHDIVEGALLARAGWEVHLLPEFGGTWEEMPTNTLDLLARERRWCQGNLQHMRLLNYPGLKPASRAHLAFGIGGYLVAPVWWAFIIGGALRVLVGESGSYGLLAYGLTERGRAAVALFTLTALLVIFPRLLSLVCALMSRETRMSFGGTARLIVSAAIEQAVAALLGPALSLATAVSVCEILAGKSTGWLQQVRVDRRIGLREAWSLHRGHVALGGILLAAVLAGHGWYAVWMAPAVLGLVLSPWITAFGSRSDLGRLARRLDLFATKDDACIKAELHRS